MSGIALASVAVFLMVLTFFTALAIYSLGDFSRSRLDEICKLRGNASRFGEILRRQEDAALATQFCEMILIAALVTVIIVWRIRSHLAGPVEVSWIPLSLEWMLFLSALIALTVIIPWTVARVAGERYLFSIWPILAALVGLTRPVIGLTRKFDTFAHRLSGLGEPENGDVATLTEEIRTVVDEGQREGVLESTARTMIHRVIELSDEDAAAIMTPRTEMDCIPVESSLEEARQHLLDAGHSRMPVIASTTDDIVGILYAKDLLKHMAKGNGQPTSLKAIVREPFYVPETTGIDRLLETMRRDRVHLAIVIDEYSGVAGLVTLEDILEEIVGEIIDEHDSEEDEQPEIKTVAPGVAEVDARVHIDDLNEQLGYDLPEHGDYDTFGGFVFAQLGHVPTISESFHWQNLRITVLSVDERRIHQLRIEVDETVESPAN